MEVRPLPHSVESTLDTWSRVLLDTLPALAVLTDDSGIIRAASPYTLQSLGFHAGDIIGKATPLLFHDLGEVRERAIRLSEELGAPVNPGLDALTVMARLEQDDRFDGHYLRKDGQRLPVTLRVRMIPARDGSPLGFIHCGDFRRPEGAVKSPLLERAIDFQDFLENSTDMAQSIAPDGHFLYVNRAWLDTLDYQVDHLPQLTIFDILHPEQLEQAANLFKQGLSGQRHSRRELILISRQGRQIMVESSNTFHLENGQLTSVQSILHDITDRKQQEQLLAEQQKQLSHANVQLALLATTDALTGLKNRRVFAERMDYECERAIRQRSPVAIILMDVDHFKEYNDSHGHLAGDGVLQAISAILLKQTRAIDCVVRYGGEEFAMILPNTVPEGARIVAERCRHAIETHHWPGSPITASFGIAGTLPRCLTDMHNLVSRADQALYQAKASGRNRVRDALDQQDARQGQ